MHVLDTNIKLLECIIPKKCNPLGCDKKRNFICAARLPKKIKIQLCNNLMLILSTSYLSWTTSIGIALIGAFDDVDVKNSNVDD